MFVLVIFIAIIGKISCHGVLQILLLGGNGFIGSHLTQTLLNHQSRILNITVLSRGTWPYDTSKNIEPYVFHIPCDRYHKDGLAKECPEFVTLMEHMTFDCVVDFSAYEPQVIQDALDVLKSRAGLYIYISSDSVYEVCEKSDSPSIEENCVRPSDPDRRKQLAEADSYGDLKLQGEEVLQSQNVVPYIILRLPDVMGERDSTGRWWFYILWIQLYETIAEAVHIPARFEGVPTSYVYVSDVAGVISNIVLGRFPPDINNQVFNLGFDVGVPLNELLEEIGYILNVDVEFEVEDKAVYMLPSVTRGPVDISKARYYLKFRPTEWKMALRKTIYYYKKAYSKFPKERDQVVAKLMRLVVPEDKRSVAIEALETIHAGGGRFIHAEL